MPRPLKVIKIDTCLACPWVCLAGMGKKPYCNNPRICSSKPYSEDKLVGIEGKIPTWCPL